MAPTRRPAPRSLADALRALSDDELVGLLRERPDLAVPAPSDLTLLATRAAGRASAQRAMDTLDTPALQVVEVLAILPEPITAAEVARRWGASATAQLDRLRRVALVWGTARGLRLVRSARELAGTHPAGLGPPLTEALGRRSPARLAELLDDLGLPVTGDPEAALQRLSAHLGDVATLEALLGQAPPGARDLLDRLTWGPPVGAVAQADRTLRASTATSPLEWLLAHGLLAVADPGHVVLPREVALALRGGVVHRTPDLAPPPLVTTPRRDGQVEGTAAAAALEVVRLVEALGELWGAAPPPLLRAGGLGVRELRRTATALDVDDAIAAFAVELAYVAGLVADDGAADARWAPTPAFDLWCGAGTGERWVLLAAAWLTTTRVSGLVGTRDSKDGVRAALGPLLDRVLAPSVRRDVLEAAAEAAPGAPDVESLRARLDWAAPRRAGRLRDALVGWALTEAGTLGLLGAGAMTAHGRALLAEGAAAAATALDAALPEPLDHVLLQADLTAVAPGPIEAGLARELTLMADVESRGGATVYRFTPGSVRRALDAGRTGEEVLSLLAARSRTAVPQPLAYLVQDAARRHGRVRVGAAGSYLRTEDEGVLAEVLADRKASGLRLRRLAPTVLAAQVGPNEVLEVLRSMGLAPVAESPDGDVVVGRPAAHRAPSRPLPRPHTGPRRPDDAALTAAVRALRAADEAGRRPGPVVAGAGAAPQLAPVDPVGALALLRRAASDRRPVWIGVVDADGRPSRRLVEPLAVDAGRITVLDRGTDEVRSFSAHRVTAVALAGG